MKTGSYKILLVEDNLEDANPIINILQKNDYDVVHVLDGTQAKVMINRNIFDLILLDIVLPEGREYGYEVCQEIKNSPSNKDKPVIYLTGLIDTESLLKGYNSGGIDYIKKPFSSRELLARIKSHLNLKRERQILRNQLAILEEEHKEKSSRLFDAMEKLNHANIDNQYDEKLKEKTEMFEKAKIDFLNMVGHELRTPLNGIVGSAQLINEENIDKDLSEIIETLKLSVERLNNLSVTALTITELEAGHKLLKENIEVKGLISNCIERAKEASQKRNIIFNTEIENTNLVIEAERKLVEHALSIIIDNAVEYSNEFSEIRLKAFLNNGKTYIECYDNGNGFPPIMLANSFKAFEIGIPHTDNNIGLGLKVCKLIMDIHSGVINLKNIKNGGACVSLIF